jgi:hypothetical protein
VAKGSHATLAGWEPKTCYLCGERIVLSGLKARGAMFRYVLGHKPTARHADCDPRAKP